jgi:hypothetical protein
MTEDQLEQEAVGWFLQRSVKIAVLRLVLASV